MSDESQAFEALSAQEYVRDRVAYKIEAYRRKGARYRWGYLFMALTGAVAAAAVPVLINWKGVPRSVPTILSLLVTILVGLEGILHSREHWKNYDMMKSFLRHELSLFKIGGGPYHGKIAADAFVLFVERVEEEISKERAQTIQMRTTRVAETEQQKGGPSSK